MAQSPAHRFGQIIGEIVESAVEPLLEIFARDHHLFLDKKGPRPARTGLKVAWRDSSGNTHDLDFVLERGGSPDKIGHPVAFVETAWRRYTKHSRNKAQEIQGAIMPLIETHKSHAPFYGVVLAGVFTQGALDQLRSLGFAVVYFPYESIQRAFDAVEIDATFDESTSDRDIGRKVRTWEKLKPKDRARVARKLVRENQSDIDGFMDRLAIVVKRRIERVTITVLSGREFEMGSVHEAIEFLAHSPRQAISVPRKTKRYEIQIRFANGDRIEAEFSDEAAAIEFLSNYRSMDK
jgi:hypothetical protein